MRILYLFSHNIIYPVLLVTVENLWKKYIFNPPITRITKSPTLQIEPVESVCVF